MKYLFITALVVFVMFSTVYASKDKCNSSNLCDCSQLAQYIKNQSFQEDAAQSVNLSKEAECLGLTYEDINKIDFQKVDLSDYVKLLFLALDDSENNNNLQIK